ncbi:MAG TPA: tetratricopeptide repeat protein [Caulobacterales bacterium]|nr:tetratricopeptide repeat protein [Caulobacterales bacterium]
MSGAAAPPLHQPPPTLALLPRIGEVVEIEHLPEWIRAAAEALPDPMDADAAGKFAEALKQVAEPAASLLRAEWLARAGEGELALAALWSIDAPAPLEDLGLTALAPYVAERLTKLRTEGDQALASGQAARASERFRLALALNPSATDAYLRLAKALGAQGRAAEARLTLQRLLARAPDDAEANALMVAMTE